MSLQGTIQGKDVVFYLERDANFVPFVCAKEMSIEVASETIPTRTVGDGPWKKFQYQSIGYSVNLGSVMKFDTVNMSGWDLLIYQINFLPIRFRMVFTDVKTGDQARLSGSVIIQNTNISAVMGDLVSSQLVLPGTGALLFQDQNNFCDSRIISTKFIQTGGVAVINITGRTGNPVRYDYNVDGGGFLSVFPSGFIAQLPLPNGLSAGTHSVKIIPYCANGVAGDEYTMDVDIAPIYTVLGRVVTIPPTTLCGGSRTALYGIPSVGSVLYTDGAMTIPVTGFNYIINGTDIYNLNTSTGQIISHSGFVCGATPVFSTWYNLDNNTGTICTASIVRLFGTFNIGNVLYTDLAMTVPITGFDYIFKNGAIFTLNSVTGEVIGFDSSITCSEPIPNDFVLGNAQTICNAPDVIYYMSTPFAIGVTIYTNLSLTTKLTGFNKFGNSQNGHVYNMNSTTAVIGSDTGSTCPVGIPVNVILGNDQSTVCDGAGVVRYVASTFATGQTLFTDIGMNNPQTGFAYVVYADATPAEIYAINTSTGVIGADTGVNCIQLSKYDLTATKYLPGLQMSVEITDETTTAVNTYTFYESGTSKVFNDVMHGGTTYRIFVSISSPRKITITDGAGLATSSFNSLTYNRTGVVAGPGGVKVEFLFIPLAF